MGMGPLRISSIFMQSHKKFMLADRERVNFSLTPTEDRVYVGTSPAEAGNIHALSKSPSIV